MSSKAAGGVGVAAGLGLVVIIIITGAFLGYNGREPVDPFPTPSVDTEVVFDFPDCDADDRSPKWDVKDCGPSPAAKKPGTPRPKTTRR